MLKNFIRLGYLFTALFIVAAWWFGAQIIQENQPLSSGLGYYAKDSTRAEQYLVQDFHFYDQDSQPLSRQRFENKIWLTDFFFSTCKTICPKMSKQLARVQFQFKEDDDVAILSFTVDPLNDTPSRLKAYSDEHKAMKGKWYFLTGDKVEIYKLAKESYFLTAMEDDKLAEGFLHSEQMVLVDKEKRIRGFYDGTDHFEVKRLIEDIATLKIEYAAQAKK